MDYRSLPHKDLLWTHGSSKSEVSAFSTNFPSQLHYYKTHVVSSTNPWSQESLMTGSTSRAWKLQSSLLFPFSSQSPCPFLLCIQYGHLVAPVLLNLGKRSLPLYIYIQSVQVQIHLTIWTRAQNCRMISGRHLTDKLQRHWTQNQQVIVYSQHVNKELMAPWNTSSCTALLSQWPGPNFTYYATL